MLYSVIYTYISFLVRSIYTHFIIFNKIISEYLHFSWGNLPTWYSGCHFWPKTLQNDLTALILCSVGHHPSLDGERVKTERG